MGFHVSLGDCSALFLGFQARIWTDYMVAPTYPRKGIWKETLIVIVIVIFVVIFIG